MNKHKQNKGETVMGKIQTKRQQGFTIIEVVLVLAIAGLIFLIVFMAVPALQASRRDTKRRSDAGQIAAEIESGAANRNGTYPPLADVQALAAEYDDPKEGDAYGKVDTFAEVVPGKFYYGTKLICKDGSLGTAVGTARQYAFVMGLERGGSYCIDNQ